MLSPFVYSHSSYLSRQSSIPSDEVLLHISYLVRGLPASLILRSVFYIKQIVDISRISLFNSDYTCPNNDRNRNFRHLPLSNKLFRAQLFVRNSSRYSGRKLLGLTCNLKVHRPVHKRVPLVPILT